MKNELIAVPVFQDRVSPLMDVSSRFIIYETEEGEIRQKMNISLNTDGESQRVDKLKEIGINTIICGAVSGYIAHLVNDRGMRLLSMIYGPIDEIIAHYLNNTLGSYCSGGGCNSRKRQWQGQCRRGSRAMRQNNASEE